MQHSAAIKELPDFDMDTPSGVVVLHGIAHPSASCQARETIRHSCAQTIDIDSSAHSMDQRRALASSASISCPTEAATNAVISLWS